MPKPQNIASSIAPSADTAPSPAKVSYPTGDLLPQVGDDLSFSQDDPGFQKDSTGDFGDFESALSEFDAIFQDPVDASNNEQASFDALDNNLADNDASLSNTPFAAFDSILADLSAAVSIGQSLFDALFNIGGF